MKLCKIFILLIPALVSAQEFRFVLETDSIPVVINHWQPFCPWAGGESESYPSLYDIDNDGDHDFFVGNYWGRIIYYDNIGTGSSPEYTFITKEFAEVDLSGNTYAGRTSPEFCDIDGDGDFDLFTGDGRGLIHYWENIGTANNAYYEFRTDSFSYFGASGYSKLDFKDIDSDGDFDLFLGNYFGNIWYYENRGTASNYDFHLTTELFAGIDVGQNASPCFIDIDGDRDYDLFIGEHYGRIWYYRNDGDSVNYNFVYVTDNFEGIDVGDYASPEFADIDGDGDYDLFVGREAGYGTIEPFGDIFFYENVGSPVTPQYQLITRNYLTLDLGCSNTMPQIVDINGDGARDMVIGTFYDLEYFQSTGDSINPSFRYVDWGGGGINFDAGFPFLVDIDADGDLDLFLGGSAIPGPPSLALYLNQGTPQQPRFALYNANFITNPNFFVNLCPGLIDIDSDGDYDLFLTDDDGYFYYYQNDGSQFWPSFRYITSTWQGIYYPYPNCGWRRFCFTDIDYDGDYDLLMRNYNLSNVRFYRNTGSPDSANLILEEENFFSDYYIYFASPDVFDVDSDGDLDVFIGDGFGGLMFFRNISGESPLQITLIPLQPPINIPPSGGSFNFTFQLQNLTQDPLGFDAWTMVIMPNGSIYGPVLRRDGLTIQAGATISRQIIQTVPGSAPPGDYIYIGNVGVYPDTIWCSDEFPFVKRP